MSEGDDEDIIETSLVAGARLAVENSVCISDWYVATSPKDGYGAMAEGSWGEWVTLAKLILEENDRRRG